MMHLLCNCEWPLETLEEGLSLLFYEIDGSDQKNCLSGLFQAMNIKSHEDFSELNPALHDRVKGHLDRGQLSPTQFGATILHAAPCLVPLAGEKEVFFIVVKSNRRSLQLLHRDGQKSWIRKDDIKQLVFPPNSEKEMMLKDIEALTGKLDTKSKKKLEQTLWQDEKNKVFYKIRQVAEENILKSLSATPVPTLLFFYLLSHLLQYLAWVLTSFIIMQGSLKGHIQDSFMQAFCLLAISIVPLKMLTIWLQGRFAVEAGAFFKRRVFSGILSVSIHDIRKLGLGQLMGKTMEIYGLETVAMSGGLLFLTSLIEILVGTGLLLMGPFPVFYFLIIIFWLGFSYFLFKRMLAAKMDWAFNSRIGLTHEMIEKMLGHRTRIVQDQEEFYHRAEDAKLSHYHKLSKKLDSESSHFLSVVHRGWVILALIPLLLALIFGHLDLQELAITLGGVLLIFFSLQSLTLGVWGLSDAWVSWQLVRDLLFPRKTQFNPIPEGENHAFSNSDILLEARHLTHQYSGREKGPVFENLSLEIKRGEKLYLVGESGAGKSTLAAILAGLETPNQGVVLFNGMDRPSWGDLLWKKKICLVPTEQENHIFHAPLVFNILMGRHWPATEKDMQMVFDLCQRLGLGALIQEMPAGLFQILGDGGWQLSSGEKQRIYLARAIVQNVDMAIMDESFSALDPDTARQCINVAKEKIPTLIVIGHP